MEAPSNPAGPREPLAAPPSHDTTPQDKLFPIWERMLKFGWIAGLAAAAIVGYRFWKPVAAVPVIPPIHFARTTQWASERGLTLAPAISPDGNRVAFASDRAGPGSIAIWIKPFDSGEPV